MGQVIPARFKFDLRNPPGGPVSVPPGHRKGQVEVHYVLYDERVGVDTLVDGVRGTARRTAGSPLLRVSFKVPFEFDVVEGE
jgi:hypothetical protein